MSDQPNYYAAPDAELEPEAYDELDDHASRDAPTSFGDTISASLHLFKKAFVPLIGIAFVWGLIDGATDIASEWAMSNFEQSGDLVMLAIFSLALLITFVGGVFFWAVGLRRVANIHRTGTFGGEWSAGLKRFFPLAGYFILMGLIVGAIVMVPLLAIIVPSALVGVPGLLVFFLALLALIPGMVVLFFLFVGDVHLVVTGEGPLDALTRSYNLVKGVNNWFFTFGFVVIMAVIVALPFVVLVACVGTTTFLATESAEAVELVAAGMNPFLNIFVYPFVLAFNYMLYEALMARKKFYFAAMAEDPRAYAEPQSGGSGPQYGSRQRRDFQTDGAEKDQPPPPSGPSLYGSNPVLGQGPPSQARQGPPPGAEGPPAATSPDPQPSSGTDGDVGGASDDDDSPEW